MLNYTDDLYVSFGADPDVHGLEHSATIATHPPRAAQSHLKLIESGVRHMGTEKAYDIYSRIQKALEELHIEMCFNTVVEDFIIEQLPSGDKDHQRSCH